MAWVKRNLGLVIGGVVALALMALAGYYLWTKIQDDQAVTAQLEEQTQQFQQLLSRPYLPKGGKVNNIEIAKDENKRLNDILQQVRAHFGTRQIPTNITAREFRAMLDRTIYDLQKEAENLGITLPEKDYWFTFAPEKQAVEFKNTEMLTYQLMDVKDLCDIMYNAKIHDLKRIKRVPASSDDNNQTDFFDKKASTNDVAIVTPYEITFQGFSTELARVMEGLINAKHVFVVKSVVAQKAPEEAQNTLGSMPVMSNPYSRYSSRYAPPVQQMAPRSQRPSNVLLDESKLQFVLQIDAVRLKPVEGKGPRKAAASAEVAQAQP
jgi:hypothetical protein